jgi:hypothetical protein
MICPGGAGAYACAYPVKDVAKVSARSLLYTSLCTSTRLSTRHAWRRAPQALRQLRNGTGERAMLTNSLRPVTGKLSQLFC